MKYTGNYNLKKPDGTDVVNIEDINGNMDTLDLTLFNLNKDKVDKVVGKGLSTNDYTTVEKNKLAGVEIGATKYNHPSTHPASMITESTTKRFTSDTEKAKWNKTDTDLGTHMADYTQQLGTAELVTTDKTLKGAVNEAFTSANNGKTAIASAVTTKGVSASPSDTFPILATKIGQISTGKKWASGSGKTTQTQSSFTAVGGAGYFWASMEVSDIGFKPSVVITSISGIVTAIYVRDVAERVFIRDKSYLVTFEVASYPIYVNYSGFRFPYDSANTPFNWIAFE